MDCIRLFCKDHLCLDKVTNPVCSLIKKGKTCEKVQMVAGCIGVICSMVCLALGIAAAGTGLLGAFTVSLGVVALLLGIILFCISIYDVLERHGGLGCPIKMTREPAPEILVKFTKGKDGQEDCAVIVECSK